MKLLDKMHKDKTMLSYCLKCEKIKIKKIENINARVSKTSNNKGMLISKCAMWGTKKSRLT